MKPQLTAEHEQCMREIARLFHKRDAEQAFAFTPAMVARGLGWSVEKAERVFSELQDAGLIARPSEMPS